MDIAERNRKKAIVYFMFITAMTGLGLGLSDSVFSNYFRDAYYADAQIRGLIEIPRESPGVITMFIVSALAFLGNVKLAIIAQILSIVGITVLGFWTPPIMVMFVFLFINSLGMHMFMPIADAMGMDLAKSDNVGTVLGRFKGVRMAFTMLASVLVFFGFRVGFFSFTTPIIVNFLIAGILFTGVLILLFRILPLMPATKVGKSRFVIKRRYTKFYLLACLFGARKQIMYVFGPWVLIELLGFGADRMALLIIAGSGIGVFFIPAVSRWIDRFGTRKIMLIEASIFLLIYTGYVIVSHGLHNGAFIGVTAVLVFAIVINIADRMTIQFGMVRSVYMRSIAETPDDVTPTLATGMALDHVLSIICAVFCGFVWIEFGPHFVFIFAGILTAANMLVAFSIKSIQIS